MGGSDDISIGCLLDACHGVVESHDVAEPLSHGIEEGELEPASVHRHLRPAVSRRQAAGLDQIVCPYRFPYRSAVGPIPSAAISSARPSSVSSRIACGSRLMPTPRPRMTRDRSRMTMSRCPAASRLSAAASPPIPRPR